MLRRLKDVALPFIQATDAGQVLETLDAVASAAGVRLVGILPRHLVEPGDNVVGKVLFHSGVSADFRSSLRAEHQRRGQHTVMMQHAHHSPPPFTFTEAMRRLQPTGDDRWIFDLHRDHGIRDGIHCTYWPWLVFYGSDHVLKPSEFTEEIRMAVNAAGSMAVSRLKEISASSTPAPHAPLSPREISVLLHLSDGRSIGEIADRLVLSETSVKTFVRRATKKLNASSQLHAVALAVRSRLI